MIKIIEKKCKICHVILDSSRKTYCENCKKIRQKESARKWIENNKEKWNEYIRQYKKIHGKEYYSKNKNAFKIYTQNWIEKNRVKWNEYMKEYMKKNREENSSKYQKYERNRNKYKYRKRWKHENCVNCEENVNDYCKFAEKKIIYLTRKDCKKN